MQYFPKEKAVLALVVSSLILLAFALLMPTETITNVSGLEVNGVGVYWDSDCTQIRKVIDWGNLTPGSSKSIIVYIRNEIEEPIYLILSTQDWNPSNASRHMTLRWDYTGQRMNPGETLQITLTLSVYPDIKGISSFSFDILVTGSDSLPGDANRDGKVDWRDVTALGRAYGSEPGEDNWNPACDFDNNGMVDWVDLGTVGRNYGKPYS